jgi:hypothetical protein
MRLKRFEKEGKNEIKYRGKSREELAELYEELEKKRQEKELLIKTILTWFDKSLNGLYEEIRVPKADRLTEVERISCLEALLKWLKGLSFESLKEIYMRRDKRGLPFIRDFVYQMYYGEREEEKR